jgi:flavin reductase (DIM6/NTAB) family NADH-FMN oxidoreductase RutF
VGTENAVLTSGNEQDYNSMTIGWGGWGKMFNKPVTWCFLRANRYTLDYIRKDQTYTLTYFDPQFNDQVMFLGSKSGRDSEKMKENTLSYVKTPSGNVAYKESKLIVECKLTEITTVTPDDFYLQEGKDFVAEAHGEAKDYHKLVFGEITNIWIRK